MAPNPKCIVCSDEKPQVIVKTDTNRMTIKQFRDDVLVKGFNMIDPDVTNEMKGTILISSEEGETECNNDKLLADMEIIDGSILKVDDFFQNYELTVVIVHKDVEREGNLFEIIADPETLKADNEKPPVEKEKQQDNGEPKAKKARIETETNTEDSDDDLCVIEDGDDMEANQSNVSIAPKILSQKNDNNKTIDMDDDISIVENTNDDQQQNKPGTSIEKKKTSLKRARAIEIPDDDIVCIDSD